MICHLHGLQPLLICILCNLALTCDMTTVDADVGCDDMS